MDQRSVFSISIVCLLIALAVASEPGTGWSRVTGSSAQESSLQAAPAANAWGTNATASSSGVLLDDANPRGHGHRLRGERERTDNEHVTTKEEAGEDYEGEYEGEDEYEDELKAVAESHEAMSRDDTRNSNVSTTASIGKLAGTASTGARNSFDSHEVITVNDSDEDVASNEAITDELVDKYDQEVAELLKYKKERNSSQSEGSRTKTKRVPTVKKELSTQKEILIGSNETQVPKSLVPPEDTVNRLSEESEAIRRRNVASNELIKLEDPTHSERSQNEGEVAGDNRYSDSVADSPKKLDKRQETESSTEEEQRQKLRELGAQEELLKFLVKIAERRWKDVRELLANVEKLSRNALEPTKRSYEPTSTLFPYTPESSDEPSRKSRKKLKKKKKKSKHRFTTTTLTPVPATPPLLTTTETPWQTTPVQWRLVAERLFGPPWQQDLQKEPEKTTNSRYSAPQTPRALPSVRELIEQNRSRISSKSFATDRKPVVTDEVGDLENQRLLRFGTIGSRQSGQIHPDGEFTNAYDRPAESEGMPDYDVAEAYRRLRYNQLSPAARGFLSRQGEEYPGGDFNMQADGFPRSQDYEPQDRDYMLSKSWPDIGYRYSPPWKAEERGLLPIASEKWPWRQPPNDIRYWPSHNGYPSAEKSYWSALGNEEEAEEEAEAEKAWQQQRLQHTWDRNRSIWQVDKPSMVSPSWQHGERPVKLYDRDQSENVWEKGKNRSESSRSSTKQESKEKIVLPQITMKTWNSLTSDPATWPHKLPGAKPWPKDENGKSYNPNADLVKKLGLDKQNNAAWSKEEAEKSNAERRSKEEKQNRLYSSKESTKEEELPRTESSMYRSNDERSNFSDYRTNDGETIKPWAMLAESKSSKEWAKTESMQGDDPSVWRRKHEGENSWPEEATLPKIQSVGAWVMAADQSTWKPYQIKPIETSDDGGAARRWSKLRSSTEAKWSNKGSWAEKMNDSWMDRSNAAFWPDKTNAAELWPGKSSKSSSWFAKAKEADAWTSKSSNPDSWKMKGEWISKPESSSWVSKMGDNNSWAARGNGGSWSTKSNESWPSKLNDDSSKFNGAKEDDSGDTWSRKSSEQNGWSTKNNELSPWQQKMNDEWSYGKASSTGAWPAKWKQFAYHRVTAMPISKPGTTADAASPKSKNAFVAVSAVSSPRYTGNEWRKNEEEARNEGGRQQEEQEHSGNQLQVGLERPMYAWKKDPGLRTSSMKGNGTDPLENQLEALRQIDFWSYKENEAEKRHASTSATTGTTSTVPTNSASSTVHRRAAGNGTGSNGLVEANRRTISMK